MSSVQHVELIENNAGGDSPDDAQVDLLRGTEKRAPTDNKIEAYYRRHHRSKEGAASVYTNTNDESQMTAEMEQLTQDVSSTAILTTLDDDLVGDIQIIERGNWTGRFDFLMSLLGYSVGLGNVWRFPYLAYSHGGGAFVFPFVLMLVLLGLPLMFMELAMGQYAALGPAAIFDRLCPLFHGLGYGMVIVSSLVSLYYTLIIGWCFFYLFASFTSELPWLRCGDWSGKNCYSFVDADICYKDNSSLFYNNICYNATAALDNNITRDMLPVNKTAPSEDYFYKYVLKVADPEDMFVDFGAPSWQLSLCLLLAWFLTFLALSKGVKSTGKVVYFTALFPYVVLTILFFRGVTLPGAGAGILYYITPQFSKLLTAQVWGDAAVQIFFALSPAWGGLITLSSYNKFHNNCYKDALIVSIGNIMTSLFAGLVIFSIIGYMAAELEQPIEHVIKEGPGLAFIVYPDVVTRLPVSPLWSVLFFVMMITLGMGSEFALMETVMTAIQDTYPVLRKKKVFVVGGVTACGFLGGLILTTRSGLYVLSLMEKFCASWSVFVIALIECIIIGWIYGAEKFLQDVEQMIGVRSRPWHHFYSIFWRFISPITLVGLLIFNLIEFKLPVMSGVSFPPFTIVIGFFLSLVPMIVIVVFAVIRVYRTPKDGLMARFRILIRHTPNWGPIDKVADTEEALTTLCDPSEQKTIQNPNFSIHANI